MDCQTINPPKRSTVYQIHVEGHGAYPVAGARPAFAPVFL